MSTDSVALKIDDLPALLERMSRVLHPLDHDRGHLPIQGYRPPNCHHSYVPPRSAGVLLPILCHPEKPTILFTVRSMNLGNHPGQVSFPGGGIESGDSDEIAASVRETYEEVGIPAANISTRGLLDYFDTISGYRVLPVVALVEVPVELKIDSNEVAECFEVPLAVALDRSRYRFQQVERDGQLHDIYSCQWQQHTIWGATAAMLINLIDKLEQE